MDNDYIRHDATLWKWFIINANRYTRIMLKCVCTYKNLYSNLAPTTYYYNTGSSSAAEALVIYEVSKENLVNGEGV